MKMTKEAAHLSRVAGGRRAKAAGGSFEDQIELAARANPNVHLFKLPNCGGRFVGKGRFVNESMPCDFVGCLAGGRALFFDAKSSTDPKRFDFQNPKLMKPHQIDFLVRMRDMGAVAGVIVRCEKLGQYLWRSASVFGGGDIAWDSELWLSLGDISKPINFAPLAEWHGRHE